MLSVQLSTVNKMEILHRRLVRQGYTKEARVLVRCIGEILWDWDNQKEVFSILDEFLAEEISEDVQVATCQK